MDNCPSIEKLQTLAIEQLGLPDHYKLIYMSLSVYHLIDQDDPGESQIAEVMLPRRQMLVGLAPSVLEEIDKWGIIQVPEATDELPDRAVFKYQLTASTGYEAEGEFPMISPNQYRQAIAALHGTLVEADKDLIRDAESWRQLQASNNLNEN